MFAKWNENGEDEEKEIKRKNSHKMKKTCEDSSSSNILIPKITDMEGIKPTNSIPIKADLLDSMSVL